MRLNALRPLSHFVKRTSVRNFLFCLLFIGLAAGLGYYLRGFISVLIIRPFLEMLDRIKHYNQFIIWYVSLSLLLLFSILKTIQYYKSPKQKESRKDRPAQNTIATMAELIAQARKSTYSQSVLTYDLYKLALSVLAHKKKVPEALIIQQLQFGSLPAPADILGYFQKAEQRESDLFSRKRFFKMKSAGTPSGVEPERVVAYLEQLMEDSHDPEHK